MLGIGVIFAVLVLQAARWQATPPAVALSEAVDPDASSLLSVTFLVAAWNAEDDIGAFISCFHALNLSDKQLVLCAGGTDDTLKRAVSYASKDVTVLVQHSGEDKQHALAKGMAAARGDIIFLTDVDCRPANSSVFPLLRHVQLHPDEAATGSVRPLERQTDKNFVAMQWAVRERSNPPHGATVEGLDGRNSAIYRGLLGSSGGLNTPATSGTDYTLAKELIKCGVTIRHIASSKMETEFPESLRVYIKKQARWLRNVYVLGRKYDAVHESRAVARTLAFPISVLVLVASGFFNAALWWAVLCLVLYSATNRMLYLKTIRRSRALMSAFSLLFGDWAAALLTLRHLVRRNYGWS